MNIDLLIWIAVAGIICLIGYDMFIRRPRKMREQYMKASHNKERGEEK